MTAPTAPTDDSDRVASVLLRDVELLARDTSRRHLDRFPALRERFGERADTRCTEDTRHHLRHLAAAVTTDHQIFTAYVQWAVDMFAGLGIESDDLRDHLQVMADVIDEHLGGPSSAAAIVREASAAVVPRSGEPESHLDTTSPVGELARDFLSLVLGGDRASGVRRVVEAADAGLPLEDIHLQVLQPVMREVGRLWQLNRVTVAQEHLVTAATQVAMAQLYPRVFATPRNGRSAVVLGVGGELHELGSRMVADLFELRGWTTRYLGANTPTRSLVELVTTQPTDVIAMSVTIAAHVPTLTDAVRSLRAATDAPIIVGGRPFLTHRDLWRHVGADGSADDARTAVELATHLAPAA